MLNRKLSDRFVDLRAGLHIVAHDQGVAFSVVRLYRDYDRAHTFMVDYEELARCTTLEAAQSARRLLSYE